MKKQFAMFRFFSLRPVLGLLAFAALCAAPAHSQTLYVANGAGNTITKITADGSSATTFASGLNGPTGLVFDSAGNLYVANSGNGTITQFAFTNNALSTTPVTYFTAPGGAGFQGLTFDSAGNLYAADATNNRVFQITAQNTGTVYYSGTGANTLYAPQALAFDKNGTLYVGDKDSSVGNANPSRNTIVKITAASPTAGTLSTFSSSVVAYGLVFDSAGNLYAANGGSSNVLKFTTSGGTGSVYATTTGNGVTLTNPHGLAFDTAGDLYTSNTGNNLVIEIAANGTKTTFSSSGLLNSPRYLAFSPTPAPEPAPRTALVVGAAGLSAMAMTAKKRAAAK